MCKTLSMSVIYVIFSFQLIETTLKIQAISFIFSLTKTKNKQTNPNAY